MATSGSKSITVTSWDTLLFSWELESQSITSNTSTISWKMQLIAGSSGRIGSTAAKAWSVTINGTKYSGTNTVGIANNATKTLASGTTTIAHNADGTKSFSYSFSQQFAITFNGTTIGTKSGSGSGTLTTIPRKSTLSAGNGTLGTAQTLTVTRQASSFTHTITYECGTATGTIVTKSSDTSISFTPPLSLAAQNKTGTSVSLVFTITTYNGSTSVGSNTKTITCAIPSSVKPTVSIAVSDPMGYAAKYGKYIKGKSKIEVVVTASGAQGSTITAYNTTANGKTYTTTTATTSVISSSGTLTVSTTVTDSRGRTATASKSISVYDYTSPKISTLSARRCNADGSSNTSGEYLAVRFDATITALDSKNSAVYTVKYKKAPASSYTTKTLTEYSGKHSVAGGVFIFAADTASSYDVTLTAADDFGSTSRSSSGSSVSKLFSVLRRGVGIAIGKIAELEDTLDVNMVIRARKGIVVDSDWMSLTLDSDFSPYNGTADNTPQYKVMGSLVAVRGVVSPKTAYTSSTEKVVFASGIPAAYRPSKTQVYLCQGSGMNHWNMTVEANGTLTASRYGTTEVTTVPTTAWLVFNIIYSI